MELAQINAVRSRPVRDDVDDLIARNFYRWFGTKEVCLLPDPGRRNRFTFD